MLHRNIPSSMDSAIVAEIDARLDAIRSSEGVAIPLAIESGSRAWGFPSPDSDYDCRFVFVRPMAQYLTPWPRRDVIETPLEGELDVNGWDLGKAVKLLFKGNAVIIEWLTSPIAYGVNETFRDVFLDLAQEIADREMIARHYLHLGIGQRNTYFADQKAVSLKKVFYALRPAAALRWLRHHPEASVAPMHFQTLLEQCEPPSDGQAVVAELTAKKAVTRELGKAPLPKPIARFIDDEFEAATAAFPAQSQPLDSLRQDRAETFFRDAIDLVWRA
ncbi:hypothetical protein GCM10007276_34100 [Agaricicola taiwanensis]|uniref:Nucleotidyltransferase domain-containing protein n=1 Tax=Agaricicola taiwanensis TaxID=591372 RepID=A0A8J3E1J8_9RHOB|nr:nucleotidyltransferase domain-containing protein [Agaricicola taiwanensis]GGE54199.1 hypothetical protein GCM10007276_34100 [Agaricicola taiwanensis]